MTSPRTLPVAATRSAGLPPGPRAEDDVRDHAVIATHRLRPSTSARSRRFARCTARRRRCRATPPRSYSPGRTASGSRSPIPSGASTTCRLRWVGRLRRTRCASCRAGRRRGFPAGIRLATLCQRPHIRERGCVAALVDAAVGLAGARGSIREPGLSRASSCWEPTRLRTTPLLSSGLDRVRQATVHARRGVGEVLTRTDRPAGSADRRWPRSSAVVHAVVDRDELIQPWHRPGRVAHGRRVQPRTAGASPSAARTASSDPGEQHAQRDDGARDVAPALHLRRSQRHRPPMEWHTTCDAAAAGPPFR